jgi:hypothetical protein
VYIMYGNRNKIQQVRVHRYRVYVLRNIGMYTNTASTSVQKHQYVCTPDTGCIVGEKEKSNVKICDKSVNVNSGKCVKYMYVSVICCCKKSTLVHKMWYMAQKKKLIESNAEKCRKVKIRITRKSTTKCRVPICSNVEMLTGGYRGSRCRYKLMNVNPFPVRLKMDNQSKGEQGKEEYVEMAYPALTGLNSVFTTIVSGTLLALNICPSHLVIVIWKMLNKFRSSCRAVISLDCLLSCCTSIVINESACKICLHIDRTHCALCRIVPAKIRTYVIVDLTFIIWCGRYGE